MTDRLPNSAARNDNPESPTRAASPVDPGSGRPDDRACSSTSDAPSGKPGEDAAACAICSSVPLDLRLGPTAVLAFLGLTAFAVVPLSPLIPDRPENAIRGLLGLIFLFAAIASRHRSGRGRRFVPLADALFIAVLTQYLAWRFGGPITSFIGADSPGLPGMAAAKLSQGLIIIPAIVLLVLISGARLESIYLQPGRVRYGATIGLIGLALFGLILVRQVAGSPGGLRALAAASPWLLAFVLANGLNEELLFRGLFLRRFEPFSGRLGANLAAAIVFTAAHVRLGRPLSGRMLGFLGAVFLLSLLLGYLMQKSRSLLAPWLLHAGADLLIFAGGFYL